LNSFISLIRENYGTQPFFVYDLDGMKSHLAQFQIPGVRFWYATKANPLSSVLKTAYASGFGIDCASEGEFRQALRAGVPGSQILLTGPSKSKFLLAEALAAGIQTFVLESLQQVKDLEQLAAGMNRKVDGLLRLQIAWKNDEKSVLGGSKISPFGLDFESWQALDAGALKFVKIKGVHCFQWGNILDADRLASIWQQTAREARALSDSLKFKLSILDLGGGLGIPYHGEPELQYASIESHLKKLKLELGETEIWMELGRYAIGAFGKYVTEIVDRKVVMGKNILVLEGGVHHLVRPALIGDAFPATLLSHESQSADELSFEVHGPLCTALDHLGSFTFPANVKPGDSLVFHQCGAYGFTESMPYFLCHDLPAEFVVMKNELSCLRPWQKPETWLV
jgi:diaminopimelate decarboxylase